MTISSMLLTLPAGKCLLNLPTEQIAPIEAAVRNLRLQATTKAIAANDAGRLCLADEWKAISAFAKFVARAFKMERQRRDKAMLTVELMDEMGFGKAAEPRNPYIGMSAFAAPSTDQKSCVVEASQLAFAPWIEHGDLISVDFTATALSYDGLYLVAVHGEHIAIRGFRQPTRNVWYVHESMEARPAEVRMSGKLYPTDFEIVGRIVDVYKRDVKSGGRAG